MAVSAPLPRRRAVGAALVILTLFACAEPGTGPDVSDTVVWRLDLEQVDDGAEGGDVGRRRGTITLTLRSNFTTQPDPSCAGTEEPDITTFLATVEAPASRLQTATGGTANGSWNCFGFAGEVRLDDGTVFELTSPTFTYNPARTIDHDAPMADNQWTAGKRRGHFLMAVGFRFLYDPFDTHLDVEARNDTDEDVEVSFLGLDEARSWSHHDLAYDFDRFPLLDRAIVLPAGETRTITVPSQPLPDSPGAASPPFSYGIWVRYTDPVRSHAFAYHCLMGGERQWRASVIVHGRGNLECATGWLGSIAIFPERRILFMRPGERQTLRFTTFDVAEVEVETREPSIVPRLLSFTRDPASNEGEGEIEITVGPETPFFGYSLLIRGEAILFEPEEIIEPVGLEVYDLAVDVSPDTVRLPPGGSADAVVRLDRDGAVALDMAFAVDTLPDAGFLVVPAFTPEQTTDDSTTLALRMAPDAPPGVHRMSLCVRIALDPLERCHRASLVLVVTSAPAERAFDLEVAKTVDRGRVAPGDTVTFTITAGNHGPSGAVGVQVLDALPPGLVYVSDTGAGSYSPASGLWTLGVLAPAAERTLRIRAIATASAVNLATIVAESNGESNRDNDVASAEVVVVGD